MDPMDLSGDSSDPVLKDYELLCAAEEEPVLFSSNDPEVKQKNRFQVKENFSTHQETCVPWAHAVANLFFSNPFFFPCHFFRSCFLQKRKKKSNLNFFSCRTLCLWSGLA